MQPLPFQGFKHFDFARLVHENPTMWHATLFGMRVGKPPEDEDLCREVLLELGYTLAEIRNLHHCKFNITAYFELTRGSPEEKTSSAASSTLPSSSDQPPKIDDRSSPLRSTGSAPIPTVYSPHRQPDSTSSLLSYMPDSPLMRRSRDTGTQVTERLTQSDSVITRSSSPRVPSPLGAADVHLAASAATAVEEGGSPPLPATAAVTTTSGDADAPPPPATTSSAQKGDGDDGSGSDSDGQDRIPNGGLFEFDDI